MNYSLLQKYRPKTFYEIFGQDFIINIIINILKKNFYHHSYIFSGPSGTGKTTIARILAKSFNCDNLLYGVACNNCTSCKNINNNCSNNIIEIDAASRTKIEETKELLNDIKYLPQIGKYKIYIIDEIHMLSNHSFNALLKIIEDPPKHIKFLFATTEKNKIPSTVLSRCIQFNLKKIDITNIIKYLIHILINENIKFNKKDLYNIALSSEGSMRNAVNLLEQIIYISNNNTILKNDINNILGFNNEKYLIAMLNSIIYNDTKKIILYIKKIFLNNDNNCYNIMQHMQILLNNLIKIKIYNNIKYNNHCYSKSLIILSKKIELTKIQIYNQILISTIKNIKYISDFKLEFEIMILKMLTFIPTYNNNNIFYKKITNIYYTWEEIIKNLNLSINEKNLINNCILKSWTNDKIFLLLNIDFITLYTKEIKLNIENLLKNYLKNNQINIEIVFIKEEKNINNDVHFYNKNTYIKNIIYILKNKVNKAYIK